MTRIKITRSPCCCFCDAGSSSDEWPRSSRRHFFTLSGGLLLAGALHPALAQERWNQGLNNTCSFYPNDIVNTDVFTFGSPQEGMDGVKRITIVAGLRPNFEVLQANVPNAAAVIRDEKRYILYSQVFINQIKQEATEWAAWTIMAHEVGHHLNGHTLLATSSRPVFELEADYFAGFRLIEWGARLRKPCLRTRRCVSKALKRIHHGAHGWRP
jgi:hypothetical protein